MNVHRPLLAGYGRAVLTILCGYELVALYTDLPTISQIVRRCPAAGVALLGALTHHWFLEQEADPVPR